MLSTRLMQLAEKNEWKTNPGDESVFGSYNGYLFTALDGKGFKAFITPLAGITPEATDALRRYLDGHVRQLQLRNYDISDNFLCVRQQEGLIPLSIERMEYLLGQISGLLSLYEMPVNACVICGRPASRRGLYLGFCCHLHPECENNEMIDFTAPADEDPPVAPLPGGDGG